MYVVPQILTNRAGGFYPHSQKACRIWLPGGEPESGLPFGNRGVQEKRAGFLGRGEALERFLAEVFEALDMQISLKTRLGLEEAEEFGPFTGNLQ